MPRFNTPTLTVPTEKNLAGGEAYSQSAEYEFAAIALTTVTIGVYLLWRIKERHDRELASLLDECSSKVDKTGACPGISEAEAGRAGPQDQAPLHLGRHRAAP